MKEPKNCLAFLYRDIYNGIMNEILNLKTLEKKLSEKWKSILTSKGNARLEAILDYLLFLKEQYELGVIGYITYPYYVVSLLAIDDIEEYKKLDEIIDLAGKLEIPISGTKTSKKDRIKETEKLSDLINSLKNDLETKR